MWTVKASWVLGAWLIGLVTGCGSGENGDGDGSSASGGAGKNAGGSSSSGATGSGGSAGSKPEGGDGGVFAGEPVELPPGSREVDGVVNLVDAEAAQALDDFLLDDEPVSDFLRHGLSVPLNLFLDHYLEEYDFVIFVGDHQVEGSFSAARFEAVNRPAEPGAGNVNEVAPGGYKSTGRIKGVIGVNHVGIRPPLAHEVAHYWGAYLDPSFGFGEFAGDPHWGWADTNGQLGGYDGATLECVTPAGAKPPDCAPLENGRTQYRVGSFGPNANAHRAPPYSALELYVMGLAPASEVPESFQIMVEADMLEETWDDETDTVVVEATELRSVAFADIVAHHGEKALLPETDRAFKAAFVLLSATPAPDDLIAEVASWAAGFGNRAQDPAWPSFETVAGGKATMDTELGARRTTDDPAPSPRERFECDLLAQDCGRPELACHIGPPLYCRLAGSAGIDEPCSSHSECAAGLGCVARSSGSEAYCEPYCDSNLAGGDTSCQTCPNSYRVVTNTDGETWGAICLPP